MKWIVILLLGISTIAFGNEEKKEEPKKGAAAEYAKHDSALMQFGTKVAAAEKSIKELIEEKNKTKDEEKIREIAQEIQKNLAERRDAIQKYNKEFMVIKYQFPDKGREIETKYKKFDDKKVKEFEDEVNKALSSVYENVKQKYNGGKDGI